MSMLPLDPSDSTPSSSALRGVSATVLLLVWSLVGCASQSGEESLLFQDLYPPATNGSCELPAGTDPGSTSDVMMAGVNPAMSKIMFSVTRDRSSSPAEIQTRIVDSTAVLMACLQIAATNPPPVHASQQAQYIQMYNDSRTAAAMVQLTAVENNPDELLHWYNHLRASCAGCHLVFKPDEEGL